MSHSLWLIAVWPYLALERVRQIAINNKDIDIEPKCTRKLQKCFKQRFTKDNVQMGICTISSYRGSELFEIIGLDEELTMSISSIPKLELLASKRNL